MDWLKMADELLAYNSDEGTPHTKGETRAINLASVYALVSIAESLKELAAQGNSSNQ